MKLAWGIRTRVMIVALVPTLALGVLLTMILTFSRLTDLEDAMVQRGQALARQLAAASEFGLFSGNREVLDRLANSALNNSDLQGVAIFDRDRNLMAVAGLQVHTPQAAGRAARVEQVGKHLLRITEPVTQAPVAVDDPYAMTASISVSPSEATRLGDIVVLVSLEALESRKQTQIIAALLTLGLVLSASMLLAAYMSQSVSQPISQMAQAVTDIGHGKLGTRVAEVGGGSLQQLATGINDMAARLSVARGELEQRVQASTVELRARKEEAEKANLAKSRFLAAASHDLRQPMHALGLFIADLARKEHSADNRYLIDRIAASAEAMENLLDSLLDISKLDAGVVPVSIQTFALGPVFERIEGDFASAARDRGLRLRICPTSLWIESDPLLLERILLNLISNALRYTPRGSVLVAARRRGGNRVRIEVRDSGPGIPKEAQDAVFQEFVQLDNPARDRSKGLGLGLAIVRRLAELLGHTVGLRSAVGRGSIFHIEVPQARPVDAPSVTHTQQHDLTGEVVAMVDDDALAQQSLAGLLRAWGCFVVAADSLEGLFDALDETGVEPRIIISDYRLPGDKDGLDVIASVRACYNPRMPGLLLSGDTGPETLRQATDQGIPLLHKPVRPARLRAALTHLLSPDA